MKSTIIRERSKLIIAPLQNSKKDHVAGSLIIRDYADGKTEFLLSNKKTLDK